MRDGNVWVLCIPPKLQHYWNLTIRLFSVIYRTLIGVVLLHCDVSFLIGQFQFKSSIAVAFWVFEVCAVQFCVLGKPFTTGSPAGTIVSVGSLGRTSMMLENPKLVRTPRTSITRWACALFECVITMIWKHILLLTFLKKPELFFLHTVKWFQILLYNSHNLTSVICLHTVCSIWPIDRTLSGATTLGQNGLESNGNECSAFPKSLRLGPCHQIV